MVKEKKNEVIKLLVGRKVYTVTRKMAMATISLAKDKYKKEGLTAIVAVEKDGLISLQKEIYKDNDKFEKGLNNWSKGGYKCYFTMKQK